MISFTQRDWSAGDFVRSIEPQCAYTCLVETDTVFDERSTVVILLTGLAELRRNTGPPGQSPVTGGALTSSVDAFGLVDGRAAGFVFGADRLLEDDVDAVIGGDVRVIAGDADADTQWAADG